MSLHELYAQWLEAKEAERQAIESRRQAEDAILERLRISEQFEGIKTLQDDFFTVKISSRMNRKVDAEKLQELAAEAGLTEHINALFRWKPELNLGVWRAAAPEITAPLAGAITTMPARPSFQITIKEDK